MQKLGLDDHAIKNKLGCVGIGQNTLQCLKECVLIPHALARRFVTRTVRLKRGSKVYNVLKFRKYFITRFGKVTGNVNYPLVVVP